MVSFEAKRREINAGRLLGILDDMQNNGMDVETLQMVGKKVTEMAFNREVSKCDGVLESNIVNEPYRVAMLLKRLNEAISTFACLSDTGYYLGYIFNLGKTARDELEEKGFTEDYFCEIQERLEQLRSILFGDCLNFDNLADMMIVEAAQGLQDHNERLEDWNRKLQYELEDLKKEGKKDG